MYGRKGGKRGKPGDKGRQSEDAGGMEREKERGRDGGKEDRVMDENT